MSLSVRHQGVETTVNLIVLLFGLFINFAVCCSAMATASSSSSNLSDLTAPPPPRDRQPVLDVQDNIVRVPATMNYVSGTTTRAIIARDPDGSDSNVQGTTVEQVPVWIENGRHAEEWSLHRHGFAFLKRQVSTAIDFTSRDQVLEHYYPECEKLLRDVLGGEDSVSVTAFDHNIRMQKPEQCQAPIALVHGDYTTASAPRRLNLLSQPPKINDVHYGRIPRSLLDPEIAQECLDGRRRYAFINVWRSIDMEYPVSSLPLACVDATTVNDSDLRILELQYQDRTGENYLVVANDQHRWVYFPCMEFDEVLLIKQWDSDSQTKFSIHSAFADPTTKPNAPHRKSIEVRCLVIWNPQTGENRSSD